MRWLALSILLAIAAPAAAEIETVVGGDAMTDRTWKGLKLTSDDGGAALVFTCATGDTAPGVAFFQQGWLTSSGERFDLAYRIDRRPHREVAFRAAPDNTGGTLVPDVPGDIVGAGDYAHDVAAHQRRQTNRFVADFAKGETALVRVTDFSGRAYDHTFDVDGLYGRLGEIPCYRDPTAP